MREPIQEEGLLEALAALSKPDVEPALRERIRQDCRVALQRTRRRSAGRPAPNGVRPVFTWEAVLAGTLAACFLLGVLERTLMVLGH